MHRVIKQNLYDSNATVLRGVLTPVQAVAEVSEGGIMCLHPPVNEHRAVYAVSGLCAAYPEPVPFSIARLEEQCGGDTYAYARERARSSRIEDQIRRR